MESNNEQVVVDTKIEAQINSLTDTVSKILSKSKRTDSEHLFETLLARKLEISCLRSPLQKQKIVNPAILDYADLESMFIKQLTGTIIAYLLEVLI